MYLLTYVLLTAFLLVGRSPETLASDILYVEVTNNTHLMDYVPDFLTELESVLVREDITFVTVQTAEDAENYGEFWLQESLHIVFFDDMIMVSPYTTHRLSISPALSGTFRYMSVVDAIPGTSALSLAVGMSLYVFERCDAATSYFEAIDGQQMSTEFFALQALDFYLGNCALIGGNQERAMLHYDKALGDATGEQLIHFAYVAVNKAWLLLHRGEASEAFMIMDAVLSAEEKYVNHQFDYTQLLTARARLYALDFRFDDAIADMDTAIALQPENPELYIERGQIVMLLYEWDRVLDNYNTALGLDPDNADAYFHRGVLYYSILEREPALTDFEQYLELAPNGYYAPEAERYTESIQAELEALDR